MRVTSFEEACKVRGIDPNNLPQVDALPEQHRKSIIAYYMLIIITEAINTDENGKMWTPNWNDSDEWKYFPYYWIKATKSKPSGVGFSGSYYGRSGSTTRLGSRLCFSNIKDCLYAAVTFEKIYQDYFLVE